MRSMYSSLGERLRKRPFLLVVHLGFREQAARDYCGGERRKTVAQILDQRVTTRECVGAGQPLESAHGPKPLLEVAVIALQGIVQVSRAPMLDARQDRP
jgi:hypothetical protein